ncbi:MULTISPECIES: NAD-dependent epimerase/dehydratase family protein [unclassified Marinobacter]|uniref:NAD-dependent epimerase/dehydratase family protein n=1 Tax=unclassified Marinobacter TaxID=83889 RepID=UPI0026E14F1A|nr:MULTISPECIES: NAD-dependent epimerase/dehydratase family protein [unclassified Marinobacter]MDO6442704.1 oxidoreductase [Marinobacter sp. 2_MG-2023]MDO6823080.1 oxidoreductase [Marinobacter sp. 1_MG-2023]
MRVLLLGATGLTGGLVLSELLGRDEVELVNVPLRRKLRLEHSKLHQEEIDFDHMGDYTGLFQVDAIICCLGTTIKKAGSQEQFRKVDFGYGLKAAELGRVEGAKAFILMSAIGSSSSSTIFYNRVKGELEDGVKGLEYPYLSIYHPSLLLGARNEHRLGEAVGVKAMPLINRALVGPLEKYRAIEAATVASAMVNEVCNLACESAAEQVVQIREYQDIVRLSAQTA